MAQSTTNTSMMKIRNIFVDTSARFAIINSKDVDHKRAADFLKKLVHQRTAIIVTNFIIAEIYTLLLRKIGRDTAVSYVESLYGNSEVVRVTVDDEKRAWQIILKFQDKDFSYVRCHNFCSNGEIGNKRSFYLRQTFSTIWIQQFAIDCRGEMRQGGWGRFKLKKREMA